MKNNFQFAGLIALFGIAVLTPTSARGDNAAAALKPNPTFAADIAPLFNSHCVSCHRPGEIGPMSLTSYDEARPWVKSIRKTVAARQMPPWDADPAFGHWSNDISLSENEIATILAWVDQGAAKGNGEPAPPPIAPSGGWTLGEPDFVIDLPEVAVPAEGADQFPDQLMTLDLPEGKWLSAVEILPGNREVLHHVVAFLGEAAMRANAQGEAQPVTLNGNDIAIASIWAAGTPPTVNPPGMGHPLKTKQTFTFNMHYHPSGKAATDRTRVGLHFGKGELVKRLRTLAGMNTGFLIPPGEANYKSHARFYFNQDSDIVSLFPHMHLRGKDFEYRIHRPDGSSETLLRVPGYDFQWQWVYYPKTPISAPAGSVVEITGHFDNSAGNPANPDPSLTIGFGEQTNDEMIIGFMEAVPKEGIEFPRENAAKLMSDFLGRGESKDAYLIRFEGMLPVSAALVLPKDKTDGGFYFYAASALALSPVTHIAWEGNRVTGRMVLFTNELKLVGTVAEDNTIEVKLKAPPLVASTPPQAKFLYRMLENLKGKKLEAPVVVSQSQ